MIRLILIMLPVLMAGMVFCMGCGGSGGDDDDDSAHDDDSDDDDDTGEEDYVVRVEGYALSYWGDLWPSAWASDDTLLLAWGDGTGQGDCIPSIPSILHAPPDEWQWESCGDGRFWVYETCPRGCPLDQDKFCRLNGCGPAQCYPLCTLARFGFRRDSGPVEGLLPCESSESGDPLVREDSCILALDPPDQNLDADRKASSLLVLGEDTLYAHVHTPCCDATSLGFIMTYDGADWTVVTDEAYPDDSPWGEDSHFRVGMFIQMGKNHELSPDGYVYMLGIDYEVEPLLQNQAVYLARVPAGEIGGPGYDGWEYLAYDGNEYYFSTDQSIAVPVAGDLGETTNPGGGTIAQGSAMYHAGLGMYVFLTGIVDLEPGDDADTLDGAVFLAEAPWGPWTRVHKWEDAQNHGFVPGLIAKDAGPNCLYFAYAGLPVATVLTYNLHIDKLIFRTPCDTDADCGCGSWCKGGLCDPVE